VFCEKPIATDLPETIEAINTCKQVLLRKIKREEAHK
jgi:predicted dehydrogenase